MLPNEPPTIGDDSLIGAKLGEYRVEAVVGSGGMATVYAGIEPRIGKRVAIKVVKTAFASDRNLAQRLVAEAQAVNAIHHRGIVDIFAFGELPDGRPYLVMEWLAGEPLSNLIERHGPLDLPSTVQILEELCVALGAAHAHGIVHRDVKPSNVFLVKHPNDAPYVKLLDFGLAERTLLPHPTQGDGSTPSVFGTPAYIAPEILAREPASPRTDLYSLGALAYEMSTGHVPFESRDIGEVLRMQIEDTPRAPSARCADIPPELDALILALLAKAPAGRPASAKDVKLELQMVRKAVARAVTQVDTTIIRTLISEAITAPGGPPASGPVTDEGKKPRRWPWGLATAMAAG